MERMPVPSLSSRSRAASSASGKQPQKKQRLDEDGARRDLPAAPDQDSESSSSSDRSALAQIQSLRPIKNPVVRRRVVDTDPDPDPDNADFHPDTDPDDDSDTPTREEAATRDPLNGGSRTRQGAEAVTTTQPVEITMAGYHAYKTWRGENAARPSPRY